MVAALRDCDSSECGSAGGETMELLCLMSSLRRAGRLFTDESVLTLTLEETVRHRNNQQILTLLSGIGQTVFINDLTPSEISAAASRMQQLSDVNGIRDAAISLSHAHFTSPEDRLETKR